MFIDREHRRECRDGGVWVKCGPSEQGGALQLTCNSSNSSYESCVTLQGTVSSERELDVRSVHRQCVEGIAGVDREFASDGASQEWPWKLENGQSTFQIPSGDCLCRASSRVPVERVTP